MKATLLFILVTLSLVMCTSDDSETSIGISQDVTEGICCSLNNQNRLAGLVSTLSQPFIQGGCAVIFRKRLDSPPIPLQLAYEHILDRPWNSLIAALCILTIFMESLRHPVGDQAMRLKSTTFFAELITLLMVPVLWQVPEMACLIFVLSVSILGLNLYRIMYEK